MAEAMEIDGLEDKPPVPLAAEPPVPAGGTTVTTAGHKTQKFPALLPMQHPFEGDKLFVRNCYETLYDEVIDELFTKGKRCVTITGAPGNGKSIFYAYFFQRFRRDPERQHFTILTAAFSKLSRLIKAAAFKGEQDEPIRSCMWPFSEEFNTSVWQATGNDIIRLYDGPPSVEVPHPQKMVCFTRPNESWLEKFDKDRTKQTLYMPVWSPAELWTAATLLGYDRQDPPLTQDIINDRFEKFGGVAREGLELSEQDVQSRLERLVAAIKEMDSDVVAKMLKGDSVGTHDHHLCHLVPVPGKSWRCDVQIASDFVSLKLLERISTAEFEERSKLVRYLRGISEGAAYRGYLFEMKAHELLVHGSSINAITLGSDQQQGQQKTFGCAKSDDFYFFDPKKLSKATLESGPYHIPRVSTFESVDAFYYPYGGGMFSMKRILLFQMTVASRHPVNGKGIVAVLKSLGLLNNAIKHPRSVVLIFVGPKPKSDEEERLKSAQNIPWDLLANSESVDILPGVGVEKTRELKRIRITTVEGLRKAVDPRTTAQRELFNRHNLGSYARILSKFDRARESIRDMLQGIPQYVWEVM